jgi:hypothetical protein
MALVLSVGCTETEDPGYEYYDPEFSTTALSFDSQGGVQSITSKYAGWWITGDIYINGEYYILNPHRDKYPDLHAEEDPRRPSTIIKIKGPWFTIDRDSALSKRITFELMPNETGKSRTLKLVIQAGTFGAGLTATQAAE